MTRHKNVGRKVLVEQLFLLLSKHMLTEYNKFHSCHSAILVRGESECRDRVSKLPMIDFTLIKIGSDQTLLQAL